MEEITLKEETNPMNPTFYLVIKIITIVFLVIWGTYERISAIKKDKKFPDTKNNDKNSLIIFYITIFLGYGIGIPVSFTNYGTISFLFPYLSFFGFFLVGAGLLIRLIAIKTLASQFTYKVQIIENHELITHGIYKYIRHPSYLGQILIFLGCGIAFANWISIILLFIPCVIATLNRVSIEEKVLIEHFPSQYKEYSSNTKLLIPWIY